MAIWHWLFWLAAGYFFYTYVGYPAILLLWRLIRRPRPLPPDPEFQPVVSVIVAVRNEENSIRAKLEDLTNQDYPHDRLEVWIASDQSTDATDEIVREFAQRDPRVHLAAYEDHIGKSIMINRTVPQTRGEILVLADARQRVEPDTVRRLVAHFADPVVGVVGAEMTMVDADGNPSGDCTGLYWRYERSLRQLESRLGLLTGVSGAFYAMRRCLFRELPKDNYCEDVTVALHARTSGFQVRWEPGARVYERVRDVHLEFGRKVRTLVGNYQLLYLFWPLYLPWRGRLAFTLISHKLCRLFIPLALAVMFGASAVLASTHPVYLALLAAQAALYLTGVVGLLHSKLRRARLVSACGAFCMLNWAALVALFHVLRHGPRIQWR